MKGIRIGLNLSDSGGAGGGLEGCLAQFRRAEEQGFASAWVQNAFGLDALTVVALAGRETRRLELGTAVALTHSRHPFHLAQQALSTQAATGGRFVCGLGPSHKIVIENMLGLSFEKPARHVREYLTIVKQLIDTGKCSFEGEVYRVNASLSLPGVDPCPVLVAGLGPLMRRVAGSVADGTITWMTGPRTLARTLVPDVRAAAREAGRPEPRIVASLPVALAADPAAAREAASQQFAFYGHLPSYRAMFDAEGVAGPGEIALVGDEKEIESAIEELAAAGVTDLNAIPFPVGPDAPASLARTSELLAELARR